MKKTQTEQIIRDEAGYPIFDRCQYVKDKIGDKLENNKTAQGKTKGSPYVTKCLLYQAVNGFELIDNSIAMDLSGDTLKQVYADFLDLIMWVNEVSFFVPTKQFFSSFAGISPSTYDNLLINGTAEQRDIMTRIDTAIVDLSLDASSYGYAKENTTTFRMKARGIAGHSVVEATPVDGILQRAEETMSAKDYRLQLDNITATMLTSQNKK